MNDFTDIEAELKKLRPIATSPDFVLRVEHEINRSSAQPSAGIVKRAPRFHINWLALGLGMAAALAFLIFARVDIRDSRSHSNAVVKNLSTPIPQLAVANKLVADDFTQVVYNTRDEGLVFPADSPAPMRRVRKQSRETLQWRNPQTGASLRVSYPTEQVELIPISGQ